MRQPCGCGHVGPLLLQFDRHRHGAGGRADKRRDLLGPAQRARRLRVALHEGQAVDAAFGGGRDLGRDLRPAGFLDPGPAPRRQIAIGTFVEDGNEIAPGRVPEREPFQVDAQAVAQRVGPEQLLELAHDDRGLLIDDGAVETAGLAQVLELLTDGVGARRAIHGVRGGVVRGQEPQLVVDPRKRRVHDLRRHEVGEDLLHPHVVEPLHRHQIAEPHVRGLVGDEARAAEHLVLGGALVEEDRVGVVEDGARVLHPAELEGRREEEVELAEPIGDAGVLLEPGQRRGVEVEDGVAVARDLLLVGLAVEHPERAAVALRGLDLERARGKGEEIGGDRLGFRVADLEPRPLNFARDLRAVGHRLPARRNRQRQRVAGLEIRLIEAGERQVRTRRHEERVHELGVAVERRVARAEHDGHDVLGAGRRRERSDGNHDVAVDRADRGLGPVHGHRREVRVAGREIEHQRCRRIGSRKADRRASGNRLPGSAGNVEREVVLQIGDGLRAFGGERERDPRLGVRRRRNCRTAGGRGAIMAATQSAARPMRMGGNSGPATLLAEPSD